MRVIEQVAALRVLVAEWRRQKQTIGFVPTMGNLHSGHRSLVANARSRCDRVIVSVFVNPTQFSAGEDYDDYPRTLEADSKALVEEGVDALFLPKVKALYPHGLENTTMVSIPGLSRELCGAHREGHFDGVLTVINKFLNIVTPDFLFLGEKDFQQLFLVRQMVAELMFPVEVIGVPTYREDDGLAMSSRNVYLSEEKRAKASALFQILSDIQQALVAGSDEYTALEAKGLTQLKKAGFKPDYIEIRRQSDMARAEPGDQMLVVLGAGKLGRARLIDNIQFAR